MRFVYQAVLFLTPLLFYPGLNRVFEGAKVVFLFVTGGILALSAALRDSPGPEEEKLPTHPITDWMVFFFLSYSVSCLFSMSPRLSLIGAYERQMGWIAQALLLILYFIALRAFSGKDVYWPVVIAPAGVISLHASVNTLGWFPFGFDASYQEFNNRVSSTLGHPIYLGLYLCLTAPVVAAYAFRPAIDVLVRSALGAVFLLMILAMFGTFSRGSLIGLGVGLLCFSFCYLRDVRGCGEEWKAGTRFSAGLALLSTILAGLFLAEVQFSAVVRMGAFVALAGLQCIYLHYCWKQGNRFQFGSPLLLVLAVSATAAALAFLASPGLAARMRTALFFSHSDRYQLFEGAVALLRETRFFGIGPETFRAAFLPHKSLVLAKLFPMANHDRAHNQYLHIWITQGVAGLFAYLGLLAVALRTALRIAADNRVELTERLSALGLGSALAGYSVGLLPAFDNMTTLLLFQVYLAALAGMDRRRHHAAVSALPEKLAWVDSLRRLCHRPAPRRAVFAASGVFFVYFGVSMAMADRFYIAARDDERLESRIANLRAAVRWMPHETYYLYELGRALWTRAKSQDISEADKMADLAETAALLEKSLGYTWFPENYLHLLSSVYIERGQYRTAESVLKSFLKMDPYNGALQVNLALALAYQNKVAEALSYINIWQGQWPENADNFWLAGLAYETLGDKASAEREYLRAMGIQPEKRGVYEEDLKRIRRSRLTTTAAE